LVIGGDGEEVLEACLGECYVHRLNNWTNFHIYFPPSLPDAPIDETVSLALGCGRIFLEIIAIAQSSQIKDVRGFGSPATQYAATEEMNP